MSAAAVATRPATTNNTTIRTMAGEEALIKEFAINVLDHFVEGTSASISVSEEGLSTIQWNMASLDINAIQAIEKALVQRIEEGFYSIENSEALSVTITPAVNPAICANTIYFTASNDVALNKFRDNVLKFARVGTDKQIEIQHGNINALGRHSFKALIIVGLNEKDVKSVISKAKAMKMGMGLGKIANGVTSNVGLASFVLVDEFAPAVENLAQAGAKIASSTVKTAIRVGNTVAEEFNNTAIEVANIIATSEGIKQVPDTVRRAWGILTSKGSDTNTASNSLMF